MLNADSFCSPRAELHTVRADLHCALAVFYEKLFKTEAHNARARNNGRDRGIR